MAIAILDDLSIYRSKLEPQKIMMHQRAFKVPSLLIISFCSILFSPVVIADGGAYTLFKLPAYLEQQTCVQWCLMNYDYGDYKLPGYLGCY